MRMLGIHLDLCDPQRFYRAWENLGDLDDDDCETAFEEARKLQEEPPA